MSISVDKSVVTIDGRINVHNLVASESFHQVQWILYMRGVWHKIIIFDAWRYEKDDALKIINEAVAPEEIIAFLYQKDGTNAMFFVNDCGPAIRKLCKKNLNISRYPEPNMVLQLQLRFPMMTKICLKSILLRTIGANMYNASEKSLCLKNFHKDPELEKWAHCPLTTKRIADEVLLAVLSLNCLQSLAVLNLACNSLTSLKIFSALIQNAPNLRVIDLHDNLISELACIGCLKGLPLYELILDGNPICQQYEEESKYIGDIRGIFPSIVKLDGVTLPPKGFPVNLQNFVCNPKGETFIEQFIPYYFKMYDGWVGNRTRLNLMGTYTKEALFSLSAAINPVIAGQSTPKPAERLIKYFVKSRNLLKMSDYIKTRKSLIYGREKIVKFLSDLPLTEHDRKSIRVDLTTYEDTHAVMTVQGVFRELDNSEYPLYSFSRLFVFIRNNNNFYVANDMLCVTNATEQQVEASLKSLPPVSANPTTEGEVKPYLYDKNYKIKQNMVEELAKATEMNLRWSKKCLVETDWDFQEALVIFMELYKEGTIPPEAFQL